MVWKIVYKDHRPINDFVLFSESSPLLMTFLLFYESSPPRREFAEKMTAPPLKILRLNGYDKDYKELQCFETTSFV